MNKELEEALENLKNGLFGHCRSSYLKNDEKELNAVLKVYEEQYKTIKSALERKEKLEKAWKIVRKKKVDFRLIKKCDNANTYNYLYAQRYAYDPDYMDNQLTETEFNLIKEMLEEKQ